MSESEIKQKKKIEIKKINLGEKFWEGGFFC